MTEQTQKPEAQQTFTPATKTLNEAFAKAQGLFTTVPKTKWNSFDAYAFAPLAASLEMVRAPLAKFGLSVTQHVSSDEKCVAVYTVLKHESGEELEGGVITIPLASTKPQDIGRVMTYARKYSLQALLNIASDGDVDEGQKTEPTNNKRRAQREEQAPRPTPARQERARQANEAAKSKEPGVWQRLVEVAKKQGLGIDQLVQVAKQVTKRTAVTTGLTEADFKAVVDAITEAKKDAAA